MWEDPIVNQVRKVREEHAERFQYDLSAICRDLRHEQAKAEAAGRRVVSLEPDPSQGERVLPKVRG